MNYLVTLDPQAGELEKILSGTKSMVVREFDPAQSAAYSVNPGDFLYFLRSKEETTLRVKAMVVHVMLITNNQVDDLSQTLKEMQPRLQFTEEQYNYWSEKKYVLLVEFEDAQKIEAIQVEPKKITDRSTWVSFEKLNLIQE